MAHCLHHQTYVGFRPRISSPLCHEIDHETGPRKSYIYNSGSDQDVKKKKRKKTKVEKKGRLVWVKEAFRLNPEEKIEFYKKLEEE